MKKIKRILKIIGLALSFVILLLFFPYLLNPIYNFPETHSFSGNKFYNPYSDINGIRIKANLHTHSKLDFNLTAGADSPQKVIDTYNKMNFDLITLSNYHSINPKLDSNKIYIPNYEHGINIFKNHFLMVGATKVDYLNYFFYQSIHQKQFQINRLYDQANFLIISHPDLRSGYTPFELENLTNYNAMEVHTRFSKSEELWDSVLSAGRSIWGINNDDSHDMGRFLEVGRYWSYIYSSSKNENDIISSLKFGKFFSVYGHMGFEDNYLKKFTVTDSTIIIELLNRAELIKFIGQSGKIVFEENNVSKSSYTFTPSDTYIRIVVKNDSSNFYFNPVFRYKTAPIQMPIVTVNYFYSIIYWIISSSIFLLIGFVLIKRIKLVYKTK